MKREKIFKKACKGSDIQIINNTYTDGNGEMHTRNQWVNLGGAAYLIDFPRALTENEILCLAGVPTEKICERFVRFVDVHELDVDLSGDYNESDLPIDRCKFTINNKFTLFRTANSKVEEIGLFIDEEYLDLINDEKDVDFFLRICGGESPYCIIARNGFIPIACFLPYVFHSDQRDKLADDAYTAYKNISGGLK